ncbi:MAG: ribonuclease P protein component [Gammaproteobacteria bacterium]|nr:MAG: ribonuclease P protein component [Gammaproteobacteria bacterium]
MQKTDWRLTNESFPRDNRLLNAKQYSRVFEKANKIHNKAFTLLVRKNDLGHARLGLVIAKKNVKQANQRNYIKRQVREYFRLHIQTFRSYDLVLLTRRDVASLTKTDIIAYRNKLFERFEKQIG